MLGVTNAEMRATVTVGVLEGVLDESPEQHQEARCVARHHIYSNWGRHISLEFVEVYTHNHNTYRVEYIVY